KQQTASGTPMQSQLDPRFYYLSNFHQPRTPSTPPFRK
ncbi:MAG: hypothetical protein ACI9EB_000772, partial [Pseudomonas sp.]